MSDGARWSMHEVSIRACLLVGAMIHALPLAGVTGGARLAMLYGVSADDGTLMVLLRHRAVLFGLLAGALGVAAFTPAWRAPAVVAGLVSVVAFLVIAATTPGHGAAIARVVRADWVALAALGLAAVLHATAR